MKHTRLFHLTIIVALLLGGVTPALAGPEDPEGNPPLFATLPAWWGVDAEPAGSTPPPPGIQSIDGSTITGTDCYTPDATETLCYTAYNASPDTEWLDEVGMTFPSGWTVACNSQDPADSGGNPVSFSCSASSNGVTYADSDGGYGEIYDGETWGFCIDVTAPSGASGDQTVNWSISGDVWGDPPHDITGNLTVADCTLVGWLEGYIMDGETGGVDPTCTAAAVNVQPGDRNEPADATGYYGPVSLSAGTYTVTASASGYTDQSVVVTVAAGMTTTQDFDLWRPVIDVTPEDFISVTAVINTPTTYTLAINNLGHSPLDFEINEVAPAAAVLSLSGFRPEAGIEVEPELEAQFRAEGSAGYMIYLHARPDLSPAFGMDWYERGRFVVNALQETAERSQARVRSYLDRHSVTYQTFWIDNVIVVESSDYATFQGLLAFSEIAALRAERVMGVIEPEAQAEAPQTLAIEPNISHVQADQVWSMGYMGEGMVVANIDTGVRYTHEALVDHYRGNLGGGSYSHDYNWLDPDTGNTTPYDDHGHGSHTMGTMVGDDGGTNQIGMAPGAEWIACDACNSTSGCPGAALLTCAQWVAAPYPVGDPSSPDPDMRPHVVNNSWGDCDQSYDNWYQNSVDAWHAAGIYPIFSNGNAGNCGYSSPPGCNTVGNPARYGNVTGVGSTGQSNGQYATHSNWGPTDNADTVNPRGYASLKPQVMAPGVNVRSSTSGSDSSYGSWGGTSMSAPHVSALVALMWQAAPCLQGDYATTETILEQTATAIPYTSGCGGEGPGNVPNHATGWGEINALAAVQEAMSYCDLPWVSVDPISGTVGAMDVASIDVTFLCTETRTYTGSLRVVHNDPCTSAVDIPIVLYCQDTCVPVDGADFVYSPASPEVGESVTFTGSVAAGTPPVTYAWDFGDGSTGSGQTVSHAYTADDTYTVIMTATNACGEVVASDTVVVTPPTVPDIDVAPLSLSATLNPGDTATRTLSVQNTGTADLTWSLAENPAASWLDETPTGGTLTPGGSTDVTVTFDATGLTDGVYNTTLEVTSDDPDEPQVDVSVVLTVTTACVPVDGADFVYSPASPEVGESVTFTGSVSAGTPPVSYAWDFGDGSTGSGQTVSHAYTADDTYTVIMTATNACGEVVASDTVVVTPPPEPDIDVAPLSLSATLNPGDTATRTLSVQNTGTADLTWSLAENPAASWLDETPTGGTLTPGGSTDVMVTFDATGLTDGVYNTTLEVTSDDPDEPQVDVSVVLTVTTACVPVDGADFVYSPASPEVGETVTFTGSVANGTPPVSYAWDFGDGSTGSGQEVTHVYTASHTYTVIMTATNSCGEVVASDTVVVTPPTVPDIDVAPLSLSATLNPGGTATRTLSVQNTGTADLTWSLAENPAASWLNETPTGGTLTPGGSTDVMVTFDATGLTDGVYNTTLEVTSDDPDEPQVDVSVVLTVTSACIPVDGVDFAYSPAMPEVGETVTFTGSVANGTPPITYTWYFGDGSLFVVGGRVTHVFPLTATRQSYTVTLNAANACPSQQEVEQVITVLPRYIYLPVTLRDF